MHREEIKAQLRIRFGTLSAFEEARGLPKGTAKDVLRGRTVTRTAKAIADEIGLPVQTLFPSRHGHSSTNADNSATAKPLHRLNAEGR